MNGPGPTAPSRTLVAWWDSHQVALYLVAILGGALLGLAAPRAAPSLENAINPALALLLFATFLGVPLVEVGRAFGDLRFLAAVLGGNFLVVPLLAFGLSRFVADDRGLTLGVLLVLLTPCIDYVIVFAGLAGGARARLLAAAPLLMLAQVLLLPAYLLLFAGGDVLAVVEPAPFVEAFLVLIVVPLAAAALVQALGRHHRSGRAVERATAGAMVPLMMLTLTVVIGSQIAAVGSEALQLARLVPLYAAFVVLAVPVGLAASRSAGLDVPGTRAAVFSVATRNSLVVLPLALALPESLALAPLAVVTQTMVELLAMLVLVRLVPRLAPSTPT
ncbi:bile acid:sodium symporter [Nocardioides sp. Leaf307]|uniref:bile acid:sodium symporter n=1 Tax=Nocardioides sp. Leaf307 TaxID=1736331 RepID=UPI000703AA32|nr:bile acid:sodium symporter [Nocardioides sp. Leaf307]KQQ41878.1 arsenic resistance protein [Nocardioides sp. Leaf307]